MASSRALGRNPVMRYLFLWASYAAQFPQTHHSWAQETVQQVLWNVPDGKLSDLSQTFTAGNTLPLSWNGWTSTSYIDASISLVDLWVTAWDYNLNPFSQLIKGSLNVTTSGNYAWTIAIPATDLAMSAKYVLRFKVSASSYNPNSADLSSPGFLVLEAAVSSTSTSTSTSATSSNTFNSSRTQTTITSSSATISPIATVDTGCSSCGLSTGAKTGIGLGVAVVFVALLGAAYFVFKRKVGRSETHQEKRRHQPVPLQEYVPSNSPIEMPSYPAELPAKDVGGLVELPNR